MPSQHRQDSEDPEAKEEGVSGQRAPEKRKQTQAMNSNNQNTNSKNQSLLSQLQNQSHKTTKPSKALKR